MHALLTKALQANAITLPETAIQQLSAYLALLQTWNRAFNLTAITEPEDMVYLHIVDSLLVAPCLQGTRCLDVGSGAGLPGIALAVAEPDRHWVLLDKNSKKTRFLTQVVAELGLRNVSVVHTRCEDFHPTQGFDSILARAFGTLSMFVQTTQHLLSPGGSWIAMKGKYPQDELADLPNTVEAQQIKRIVMKGTDVDRHIVCLRILGKR
jgi:16S rRNA (guanine527-N7)-methyltransferase